MKEAGPAGLIGSTGPKSFYLPIMMKGEIICTLLFLFLKTSASQ